MSDLREACLRAIATDRLELASQHLEGFREELRNQPRIVSQAKSRAMVDLLVKHGLDLEKVTDWWGPGFGVETMEPDVVDQLIARGTLATAHVLAAAGLTERLEGLLEEDPKQATARGGDGCHPLHFARDVATARLLVQHGALLDARDEDHASTPAQWRERRHGRYLLGDCALRQSTLEARDRRGRLVSHLSNWPQ